MTIQERYINGQIDKMNAAIESVLKIINYDMNAVHYEGASNESAYKNLIKSINADFVMLQRKVKAVKK